MRYVLVFTLLLLLSYPHNAKAIDLVLSEQQLTSLVNANFPNSTRYGDYIYTLSKPSIKTNYTSKQVNLRLLLKASNSNNGLLLANVTFSGEVAFVKELTSLQLINPSISEIEVIENTDPQNINVEGIKDVVGQHLPISLLIDFKHLKQFTFNIMPTNIEIVQGGVLVQF